MKANKRVDAIDFVRGISVLLMIPVHSMIVYSTMDTWNNTLLGKIAQVLEKGTPMFLVVMGLSFVFSSRLSMKSIIKRGLSVLAKGYGLNILRFVVPMIFFGGFPRAFIEGNGLTPGDSYNLLFFTLLGDILQLAGFSLIIMGIIIKFIKNKYAALISAMLIVFFSRELSGFRPGIVGLDYVCDLLWGKTYNVYFPIFPWMSFILIGLFFGMWYQERGNDIRFMFGKMLPFGIAFLFIGAGLCYYNYEYNFGDYYHLGPGGTIILMGINLLIVWLGHITVKHFPKYKLFSVFYYSSKNVTSFYLIQWVLVYWGVLFFGFGSQTSQVKLLLIITGITLLTFGILWLKEKGVLLFNKNKKVSPKIIKEATT
ncbi:heparan-alpha-glucosaminide N-acetyltransferase domain-containing protein [Tenacibaculum ovolyticum]|uniref:heparan-alpha-glucosaminide N-acetyltransferase domain-containing protein n=1 Tax=Tenacibaculum ovolyticum TaxID=104270 RepID=UPI0022F3DD93|nr:heparan-alpha-glucosaminide N-acetyltransferase domain-containing protein [Tenacibaculum ovolyticum]WBX77062.1 heparan-alpha-glucosaminide N-acetyltransferase domain-containing protein [Tenacibaculum ovolyticum]